MAPIKRMAKRLRQLRNANGWTQQELATRTGISRVHIARLETARMEPGLIVLERLAKAFKVKVGDLVD
jgi:transcriptional regulator with XRE-family HTH domain